MARFALLLLLAFPTPQETEKKYVLDFSTRMFAGRTFDFELEASSQSRCVYGEGFENKGDIVARSSRALIVGTCEVLSWKRPTDFEMRWTFRKCERMEDGKAISTGILDKRIRLLIRPTEEREYSCEDGPRLGAADEAELDDIIEQVFKSPKRRTSSDKMEREGRFSTSIPRKVGESWTSPVDGFFDGLLGDVGGVSLDESKSEITYTLSTVKERDGSRMAVVESRSRLILSRIGPAILEGGFPLDASMTLEGSLDGKSGYREMIIVWKGKGTVNVRMPGKLPASLEYDSQKTEKRIRRDRL